MNQIDLNDRVAIVTGGSGGIGIATADRMLRSGAKVVIWDRSRDLVDAARKALPALSGIVVDVTDERASSARQRKPSTVSGASRSWSTRPA